MPRFQTVTKNGTTYQIPEMWLVGMGRRLTFTESVAHWIAQCELEAEWLRQYAND